MPVMIDFAPTAFTTGPLARFAADRRSIRWVLQTGSRTSVHIDINVPFRDNYAQPPNSICIVVRGDQPSWIDTVEEFNRLEYFEIRAQLANAIERGILRVRGPGGADVTVADLRSGTVKTGSGQQATLDVSITT